MTTRSNCTINISKLRRCAKRKSKNSCRHRAAPAAMTTISAGAEFLSLYLRRCAATTFTNLKKSVPKTPVLMGSI